MGALPMHGVVATLDHSFQSVRSDEERDALLGDLLQQSNRTMVFCKTANRAAAVAERLASTGIAAAPYTKDVAPDRRLATLICSLRPKSACSSARTWPRAG